MRDQLRAEHGIGVVANFVARTGQLDAARLAPPTGVHLRLDHPQVTAQLFGRCNCCVRTLDGDASRYRNAIFGK